MPGGRATLARIRVRPCVLLTGPRARPMPAVSDSRAPAWVDRGPEPLCQEPRMGLAICPDTGSPSLPPSSGLGSQATDAPSGTCQAGGTQASRPHCFADPSRQHCWPFSGLPAIRRIPGAGSWDGVPGPRQPSPGLPSPTPARPHQQAAAMTAALFLPQSSSSPFSPRQRLNSFPTTPGAPVSQHPAPAGLRGALRATASQGLPRPQRGQCPSKSSLSPAPPPATSEPGGASKLPLGCDATLPGPPGARCRGSQPGRGPWRRSLAPASGLS